MLELMCTGPGSKSLARYLALIPLESFATFGVQDLSDGTSTPVSSEGWNEHAAVRWTLPEGKLDLRPYKRTWKVGRTHVHRRGFQIAPDFAGTAHAFCGSTLSACKGDLLHWSATPTPESMLRAYIIRSRVRSTDDILLVQPYSPQLFRQVKLPGPALLLARQSGALSDQTSIQVLYHCI